MVFRRESRGLEFDRVTFFTDAIFAIAMTVIVVGIGHPVLTNEDDAGDLAGELGDLWQEVFSFFLSFLVLGSLWKAHHQFYGRIVVIDSGLIWLNLAYLAFIAFLPFPTDLLGSYAQNPLAVAVYALNVGLVLLLELAVLERASRKGLFRRPMTPETRRWALIASSVPALVFLASIPVAFLHPTAALYSWLLIFPLVMVVRRLRPATAQEGA